jgi:hypothetical protein
MGFRVAVIVVGGCCCCSSCVAIASADDDDEEEEEEQERQRSRSRSRSGRVENRRPVETEQRDWWRGHYCELIPPAWGGGGGQGVVGPRGRSRTRETTHCQRSSLAH